MGSSWIRDRTRVSCIGKRILYHWTTREAPVLHFWEPIREREREREREKDLANVYCFLEFCPMDIPNIFFSVSVLMFRLFLVVLNIQTPLQWASWSSFPWACSHNLGPHFCSAVVHKWKVHCCSKSNAIGCVRTPTCLSFLHLDPSWFIRMALQHILFSDEKRVTVTILSVT